MRLKEVGPLLQLLRVHCSTISLSQGANKGANAKEEQDGNAHFLEGSDRLEVSNYAVLFVKLKWLKKR